MVVIMRCGENSGVMTGVVGVMTGPYDDRNRTIHQDNENISVTSEVWTQEYGHYLKEEPTKQDCHSPHKSLFIVLLGTLLLYLDI